VQRSDKRVHFEFLDNSVQLPERPRTVAFGSNDEMNVLDVGCLLDVERYRRVNVDATSPQALYPNPELLAAQLNAGFLRQCIERFREVRFADQASGRVWLRVAHGTPVWADRDALAAAIVDPDTRAALAAAVPHALDGTLSAAAAPRYLADFARDEPIRTLGAWGGASLQERDPVTERQQARP
jgi:hypothetical protein